MEILIAILCLINIAISMVIIAYLAFPENKSARAPAIFSRQSHKRKPVWNSESKELIVEQRDTESTARL